MKITTLTEYKCHDTQALKLLQALAYARETFLTTSSQTHNQLSALTESSETTTDFDSDGINDIVDNCPTTPNPNQNDTDDDNIGDACDNCPEDNNPHCGTSGRCIAIRGPATGQPCVFPFKWQNVSPSIFTQQLSTFFLYKEGPLLLC